MQNTINKVQELLTTNPEWIDRYHQYAIAINKNLERLAEKKTKFHEWSPLHLYMNVKEAKSGLLFSLRYLGQDVAKLKVKGDEITISTKGFEGNNERDFRCNIKLDDVDWRSKEASEFRKHFLTNPVRNNSTTNKLLMK